MSDPLSWAPWDHHNSAPDAPYLLSFVERTCFAGFLVNAVFYGIVVALFLRCLGSLLFPMNRTSEGRKWGLAAHAVAMFSCVTIFAVVYSDLQSIFYVDKRPYVVEPWVVGYPGLLHYPFMLMTKTGLDLVPNIVFVLTGWLANGFLLHRCFNMYVMNYWVIAIPWLLYLASVVLGILFIYYLALESVSQNLNYLAFWAPLSLNILLALMIVVRLVLHHKSLRNFMGTSAGAGGLCKTIATILVESASLSAVSSLLFLVPWVSLHPSANIFFPILVQSQVIAPFLITIRIANGTALTSDAIASGDVTSIHFGSEADSVTRDEVITDVKAPLGFDKLK